MSFNKKTKTSTKEKGCDSEKMIKTIMLNSSLIQLQCDEDHFFEFSPMIYLDIIYSDSMDVDD